VRGVNGALCELGYEVTLVKDATADYGGEFMHAALVTNLPNYASAIVTTKEAVDMLSGAKALGMSLQLIGKVRSV
jgi:nicotinamidase-related amidase